MDETIRIRSVEQSDWSAMLQGFQPHEVKELLEVFSASGLPVGTICESIDGKYYINGQLDVNYASLQAAGALIKSEDEAV